MTNGWKARDCFAKRTKSQAEYGSRDDTVETASKGVPLGLSTTRDQNSFLRWQQENVGEKDEQGDGGNEALQHEPPSRAPSPTREVISLKMPAKSS